MKKHTKIIAILLAGSLLTVSGLRAKDHHSAKHHDGKIMHMMKNLDLTDAQQDAIKAIRDRQKGNMKQHKTQMKSIREAMKQQVTSDNFNLNEVRRLAHEKAVIIETMTVSKAQTMHSVHQQLNPEQRAELAKLKAKMHDKKKSREVFYCRGFLFIFHIAAQTFSEYFRLSMPEASRPYSSQSRHELI